MSHAMNTRNSTLKEKDFILAIGISSVAFYWGTFLEFPFGYDKAMSPISYDIPHYVGLIWGLISKFHSYPNAHKFDSSLFVLVASKIYLPNFDNGRRPSPCSHCSTQPCRAH